MLGKTVRALHRTVVVVGGCPYYRRLLDFLSAPEEILEVRIIGVKSVVVRLRKR